MNKIFRCRLYRVRGRVSLFVSFKNEFWRGFDPPYRIYFYEDEGFIYLSLRDPEPFPRYKVYQRLLQYAGRDEKSLKAVFPRPLVKKYNLTQFDVVDLHRFKFCNKGLSHKCQFLIHKSKLSNYQ